jgi:pyruvate,water dikinase
VGVRIRPKAEGPGSNARFVRAFREVGNTDVALVGGKNASLGELLRRLAPAGIRVPDGFATTAELYREFLDCNGIRAPLAGLMQRRAGGRLGLSATGKAARALILKGSFPPAAAEAIGRAYRRLCRQYRRRDIDVAVRSSATAEDLPEASFAGQQESFLNIRGEKALLDACRRCLASLFTDRAIAYRETHGFDHMKVALSVGVQRMVRSDRAGAGVMFTIDTETGFPDAVLIDAAWGLGETVVQGSVEPDEYVVFKPFLDRRDRMPLLQKRLGAKEQRLIYAGRGRNPTRLVANSPALRQKFVLGDAEILTLARWAVAIEKHYGRPMDIEWARDGADGELNIVQARPETVQSRTGAGRLKRHILKRHGERLLSGIAVGSGIAAGEVCRLARGSERSRFPDGGILVAASTDPDWVPIMKRAAAIVTDHGGRTSHAAIVSRELGLPAIVGAGNATHVLRNGRTVTVSCAEGDTGFVYDGHAEFDVEDMRLDRIPKTRTQVMLNLADPAAALRWWQLPGDGVGLARMEFIINNHIRIHPMALLRPNAVRNREASRQIRELTRAWPDRPAYFVDKLAFGIALIAASQYPRQVIVRMSDFKTNEYAELIGGSAFEPREENPMLGWRGASRYYSDDYRDGFALECRAIRRVREEIGLDNVIVMIPFCRTVAEADRVLETLAANGLERGVHGLELYVMAEIPSNIVLAGEFAQRFDGFSIGSNDLTQLVLGIDRDSERLAAQFDERNDAVKAMIAELIRVAHENGRKVGICGQAPSDYPDFAHFLVEAGIDSVSVNPDSFVAVKEVIAAAERGE